MSTDPINVCAGRLPSEQLPSCPWKVYCPCLASGVAFFSHLLSIILFARFCLVAFLALLNLDWGVKAIDGLVCSQECVFKAGGIFFPSKEKSLESGIYWSRNKWGDAKVFSIKRNKEIFAKCCWLDVRLPCIPGWHSSQILCRQMET